jgi:Tol biopolymer transport system component
VSLEIEIPKILKNLDWRDTYVGNFSPDGRWLVYSTQVSKDTDDRAVYVIATDGSVEYTVAPRGVRGDNAPRFTPDGSRVVFISNRSDGADLWSVRITDGKPGAPEIAKANIGPVTGLGFDQDGSYYFSEHIGPAAVYALGASGVYVADVDPSTWKAKNAPELISDPIRDLTVQALHWSPDGRRLAYLSDHWPIIHDFESGKDRVVLTHVPKEYLTLRGWYPGGLLVGPPPNCRLIDTETQQQRPFPMTSGDCPVASADGKALFYTTGDSAPYANDQPRPASDTVRLVRKDLETGAVQELYHVEAKRGNVTVVAPSPDGRSLLLEFARPDEKSPRQWILPLSGGEPRELRSEGRLNFLFGTWTQDSRALLFERSNEIWVQPIDGREPYGTGINFSELSPESVSPDGSRIAFLKHTPTTYTLQMIKNLFPEASAAKH